MNFVQHDPHPPIDSIHQGMPIGCRPDEPVHPGLSNVTIESHVAFDNDTNSIEPFRYVTIANENGANSDESQASALPALVRDHVALVNAIVTEGALVPGKRAGGR